MSDPTCHPRAQPLILAAAASGVETAITASGTRSHRVFELAGVDPARVSDPSLRLELIDYCRLIETAADETGDDLFGARFGRRFTPLHFGAVGTLFVNSPTVLEGLQALARYYGWIQENSSLELTLHRGLASLDYQIYDGRIRRRRQDAELTLAAFCGLIRHCLGPGWLPLETHFEHGQTGHRRDYQEIFGPAMCFDQGTNSILVDARTLEAPMPRPDARAFARAHDLIRRQLAAADRERRHHPAGEGVLGVLSYVIESQCKMGDVGIDAVAKRMGLTIHGLRRRLRECGTPFDELISLVRCDLALRYVEESDRPLTEIAFLLGYSELSAFSRAFRRWMGTRAAEHRRSVRG